MERELRILGDVRPFTTKVIKPRELAPLLHLDADSLGVTVPDLSQYVKALVGEVDIAVEHGLLQAVKPRQVIEVQVSQVDV